MRKRLAIVLATTSTVALSAPSARADAPTYLCTVAAVHQDDVTGWTFEGVLAGVIAHADASTVSIRCYITVDGIAQSGADTGVGSGLSVATVQSPASFAAADTATVRVCAQYTSFHGSGTACRILSVSQVPPHVVEDLGAAGWRRRSGGTEADGGLPRVDEEQGCAVVPRQFSQQVTLAV